MANLFGTGGQFGMGMLNPQSFSQLMPYIQRYYGQGYQLPPEVQNLIKQGTTVGALPSGGDPESVMKSALPKMQEQVQQGYANAGQRFGKSGMLGSGYSTALGQSQRGALSDLSQLYMQYMYNAAEGSANRGLQARLAEMNNQLQAGLQQGSWDQSMWQNQGNQLYDLMRQAATYGGNYGYGSNVSSTYPLPTNGPGPYMGYQNYQDYMNHVQGLQAKQADQEYARQQNNLAYERSRQPQYTYSPYVDQYQQQQNSQTPYGGYETYQQWKNAVNAQQPGAYNNNYLAAYGPASYNPQTFFSTPSAPSQAITPEQQTMNEQALQARIKDYWRSYYGGLSPWGRDPTQYGVPPGQVGGGRY